MFTTDKVFIYFCFFFISLLINIFFSNNFYLSYPRVLKIFFVIFFILAFKSTIINFSDNINKIYKIWAIIFLIVIFDLLFEYLNGKNIFGQHSMTGRLGSFTGYEGVIGGYFFGFCLITLSFVYYKSKNLILNLSIVLIFLLVSFLIGERANFIKTLIIIILFTVIVYKISYKIKFLSILSLVILFFFIFSNLGSEYKMRYYNQLDKLFSGGLTLYLKNSQYGSHRNVAKEIFLDNPFFGVGIKNFRIVSGDDKYNNLDHQLNHLRISTHPHEIYYEFLSETGIFGLICFLYFIIFSIISSIFNYYRNRNYYQLSSILYVCASILPIIPSGSFLSSYQSSIFWLNYAVMMGYNLKKSKF